MHQVESGPHSSTTCGLACGLLLASIDDGGYVIPPRRDLSAGLAASALVGLAFHGRVEADGRRVLVADPAPTGDAVIDPVLESLVVRRKAPDVARCLEDLSLDWTILGRAAQALEASGLIRIERRALHPLIMHRFHPVARGGPAELRARLGSLTDEDSAAATPRERALAALAGATGLLRGGPAEFTEAFDAWEIATQAGQVVSAAGPALLAVTRRRDTAPDHRLAAFAA